MNTKERNQWDWRKSPKGWPYKKDAPEDPQWIKDRSRVFKEGGNGWWRLIGTPEYGQHLKKIKEQLNDTSK